MKKIALLAVALATLGGASFAGSSAMAQGIDIGVGPGGAGITVDDGYRRGYRDRRGYVDSRNEYREERRYRRDRNWDRRRGERVYIERRY
jgi:hypothetical protein